ncbi:MAG TPA: hypothetical protein VGX78_11225, partial [Pirellulales bacterium]|nr:hypothetical protein [Pirellulales bacterium]
MIEEQWFPEDTCERPDRIERAYGIDESLFAAADEDEAYRIASGWVGDPEDQESGGFFDCNHDGPGDLTRIFALGIHQLEEVTLLRSFEEQLHEPYGIGLRGFYLGDIDSNGVPLVRQKEELEVFRVLRLR